MNEKEISHKQLVEAAYKWILKNASCGVAFKEFYSAACNGEYPDVIGFGSWGYSVLIECKTSRADFFADQKKSFRQNPILGMGSRRFYCTPTGLIKVGELPHGWGLLYVNNKLKAGTYFNPHNQEKIGGIDLPNLDKNIKAEHGLMYSALRRLHLRNRIDEIYLTQEEFSQQNPQST